LGFKLELEGESFPSPATDPEGIPFPTVHKANEGMAERAVGADGVPTLSPPVSRKPSVARALRSGANRFVLPKWSYFAGGGVVLTGIALLVLISILRVAPKPETVLAPLSAELNQDSIAAYSKAADQLVAAGRDYSKGTAALRLRAAELLLTSVAVHGEEGGKTARSEQLIAGIEPEPKLSAVEARVKALQSIMKGKARDAERLLTDRESAESSLVLGLARFADGKKSGAVEPLRRYVAARPQRLVGQFMLGRALIEDGQQEARKLLQGVVAQNPNHLGAAIALAASEETTEKQLAAAKALAAKKITIAGNRELAELYYVLGQAAGELGYQPDAVAALNKAVGYDASFLPAQIALGEALLYQGQYTEALARLKIPGNAVLADPGAMFALAGALIATSNTDQGLSLLETAMKARPKDPRGQYWLGFTALLKSPPDGVAADQGYRDALKLDPKFLPATLALATLLQQANKADESLAVLRMAETAGAPAQVLQLAWGAALLVANEPIKAEGIFRKVLETEPGSITALLGVASALEAQKKVALAKDFLEISRTAHPTLLGIRERLASLNQILGNKEEALTRLQEEIQLGPAGVSIRLAAARLALDLGKLDLTLNESKKVLDVEGRNSEATFFIGRVHEARDEKGPALAEYRRAVGWDPQPTYALAYGQLLIKVGKDQEALVTLKLAESLPQARLERGRLLFRKGDLENAIKDFQVAAKGLGNQAEPYLLQGLCYDKLGEKDKAENAWKSALLAEPTAAEPHYRLGRQAMDQGKPAVAIDHLRKAASRKPDALPWESDMFFQLGQAELLAGSKPASLQAFKKYLEVAPLDAPARPEAESQVARLSGKR
jgi:tetratricopeptide (TPR) repeat protein